MRPVDQLAPHDPERGVFGDCFRASLASLLELPASAVPHFMEDGDPDNRFPFRVNNYLYSLGHCLLTIPAKDWDMPQWCDASGVAHIYHIISGPSPRFPGLFHSVVGLNGAVVWDPHPDHTGLAGTQDDWNFEFLVRLNTGEAR
jgi:hypothetical protein